MGCKDRCGASGPGARRPQAWGAGVLPSVWTSLHRCRLVSRDVRDDERHGGLRNTNQGHRRQRPERRRDARPRTEWETGQEGERGRTEMYV